MNTYKNAANKQTVSRKPYYIVAEIAILLAAIASLVFGIILGVAWMAVFAMAWALAAFFLSDTFSKLGTKK